MVYPYGFCGMPCALCTRHRVDGVSKCPGCSCDGYYTDMCKVHHCCRDKGLEHCGKCADYPCAKLGKMGDFSNLTTNNAKQRTCDAVKQSGFQEWCDEYTLRADMLTVALERYNDGRMKRYICELFIQNDASVLRAIMDEASALNGEPKEIGKAFRRIADSKRK